MSGDTVEALRRLAELRCAPLSLRGHAVDEVLMAATESSKLGERMQVAKVLLTLVPAKVVTRDMLVAAVARVCASFDDIRVDAPRAGADLADVLATGVVEGTLRNPATGMVAPTPPQRDFVHAAAVLTAAGYVPVGFLHADIARDVNKSSGGKLDKVLKDAGSKLPGYVAPAAPAPKVVTAAPAPASAPVALPPAAAPAPAPAPAALPVPAAAATAPAPVAAAVEGGEDAFVAPTTRKKKKAAVAVVEDE